MDRAQFQMMKKAFDDHENMLLGVKRSEYANDVDALTNFKEASMMAGLSPKHYCLSLTMKHIHAIRKAVLDDKYTWCWNNEWGEGMKQRIADARNFLILLAALMEEEKGNQHIVKEEDGEI